MPSRTHTVSLLQGLVDGSDPLPRPHPQCLSFPNDEYAIYALAAMTGKVVQRSGRLLDDAELRHLLFKLAAWCSRRGKLDAKSILDEMFQIGPAVEAALEIWPEWVTSRAGVGWTIRRFKQWRCELEAAARRTYQEPLRVAEIDRKGRYLAELTNAAHVYREGKALVHCMAWSMNGEVLKRCANAPGRDRLDALAYAVKLRSGELRIFSVRNSSHDPVFTIAYGRKEQAIVAMQGKGGRRHYNGPLCEVVLALSKVVRLAEVCGLRPYCRGCRSRRPLCPDWPRGPLPPTSPQTFPGSHSSLWTGYWAIERSCLDAQGVGHDGVVLHVAGLH